MQKPARVIDPRRNRWMFSLASPGRDVFYTLYSSFLFMFILCTKKLDAAQFVAANAVIIWGRIFQAAVNPFIGALVENTRSRWGRFKPWMVVGMVFCTAAAMLIFTLPLDGWEFIVMLAVAFTVLSGTYALNDIAYWGMMPALSSDPEERNKLTSLSAFLSSVGAAAAVLLIPTLTAGELTLGGSAVTAYPILAAAFCASMLVMQLLTVFGAHEPPEFERAAEKASKLTLGDMVRVLTKNDQLMWSSFALFLESLATNIVTSTLAMFYVYLRFGYDGKLIPVIEFGFAIGAVLANALLTKCLEKYGRQRCAMFSVWLVILGGVFTLLTGLFIPSESSVLLFLTFSFGQILTGFGTNFFYLTLLIALENTVEYNEHRTGNRQEGLIFSVRPFVILLSSAVTQAVIGGVFLLLGLNDISANISTLENQVSQGILEEAVKITQIDNLLSAVGAGDIRALLVAITAIPAIIMVIGGIVFRRKYFIDEEYYDKMRRATGPRAESGNLPGESQ